MKLSSYKSTFHIYVISFVLMVGMLIAGVGMILYTITIQKVNSETVFTSWPANFTKDFSEYIIFVDDEPEIKQAGLKLLQKNNLWIQIIDKNGNEACSFHKPNEIMRHYSPSELLLLYQNDNKSFTIFTGNIQYNNEEWTYIVGFPMQISKITMYVNKARFTSGKLIVTGTIGVMILLVIISSLIYSFLITKQMDRMRKSIREISSRSYMPVISSGSLSDVYKELNTLDSEIKLSDEARVKDEKMREEWIANITHDLKTPLSPIRGYGELISELDSKAELNEIRKYGSTILKNTAYAEKLINDLKLTYQLKNQMLPINKNKQNVVRFVKELVIDILNNPEYESRNINFYAAYANIEFVFDGILLKRAINNLLINALVHNTKDTEIAVTIKEEEKIEICIQDNGRGMSSEELKNLFIRYYRGTNMETKSEGSGLGMAIARQIIELHGGKLSVKSSLGTGTSFLMEFQNKT